MNFIRIKYYCILNCILIVSSTLIHTSCLFETVEKERIEEEFTFTVYNESNSALGVNTYYQGQELHIHQILSKEEVTVCNYFSEESGIFLSVTCNIDSLKFQFPNGKGYLMSEKGNTGFDLPPVRPDIFDVTAGKYYTRDGNNFVLKITNEDFENAHLLPE